jgi:hypothetical protein
MEKSQCTICTFILFNKIEMKSWEKAIFQITDQLKTEFNLKYSFFEFSYLVGGNLKSKRMKINELNHGKYLEYIKNTTIINISLLENYPKESKNSDPQNYISINTNDNKLYKYSGLYIHMPYDILHSDFRNNLKRMFLKMLEYGSMLGEIKYALLNPMQSDNLNIYYFLGLPSSKSNEEERHRIWAWRDNNDKFNTLLRDVYFANYITRGHLNGKENVIKQIEKIIGKENIIKYENGLIFYIPNKAGDSELTQLNNSTYDQIREIFNNNNMLMTWSGK